MRRIIPLAILACALAFTAGARAQLVDGEVLVETKLVADTDAITPGKPFTVGLLMKMAPHWHTYWQYAGDSGLATTIKWDLPPGFTAGPIQWPIPEIEKDEGDLQTYIYSDETMLMVEITPPATLQPDGKKITITGKASWLVCQKECVPGHESVSVTLPVEPPIAPTRQAKPPNAELFTKYRARLPLSDGNPTIIGHLKHSWNNTKDSANLEFEIQRNVPPFLGAPTYEFFPLPAAGMTVEHPVVSAKNDSGHVSVKIDSGDPDQLAGIVVHGDAGKGDREGWFVPSLKSVASPSPSPDASPSLPAATGSLLHFLILGFFGGMLLNIMPCVLPVITLKIYGFIGQAGQARGRILQLGLAYCAGVFAWFLGLAALIVVFHFNWSFQFQNKGFVFVMLVLCLVFGLNLIGLFEVMLPGNLNNKLAALSSKDGLGGAFTHGVFTTLMGSACTAPLLGPAIGFALSQPPPIIFSFFATIAAGMAAPYFLLTLNPGWMRFLPKPGMWMVRVKQVMGLLVLATAVWFGYILFQQVAVKRDSFAPQLEAALKSGRPVFVDFTADWCINCKVNERLVLKSAAVQEAFKQDNVLLVTADWTNGDPDITKMLQQFKRAGVPAYVIYPAGSDKPIVLSELLTQQIVLDGLKEAKGKSAPN